MRRPSDLPDDSELALPYERTFDCALGLEWEDTVEGEVRAGLEIVDHVRTADGTVPTGVLASAAEAVASYGAWRACPHGFTAVGLSNDTCSLKAVSAGRLRVCGRERTSADSTGTSVWAVDAFDDTGALCATSVVIMARVARRPA